MDSLTDCIERLHLKEQFIFEELYKTCISVQKCYINYEQFKLLNVKIGSSVIVQPPNSNNASLCRIYPKKSYPKNTISYDSSVSLKQLKNSKEITPINCVPASNLTVTILFNNLDSLSKWSEDPNSLVDLLKKYIFKWFIVCEQSCLSLENLPENWRFGISKIIFHGNETCKAYLVKNKTKITIKEKLTEQHYNDTVKYCDDIYSMETYLDRLSEIIKLNELFVRSKKNRIFPPTKQILLVGPSGCGKSSIIRILARNFNCILIPILGQDINFKDPGETESALRKIFQQAFEFCKIHGKCIICVDEIDNICPKEVIGSPHIQRRTSQFALLLDKAQNIPGIIVIATTNKPHHINPSIRRYGRLETEIYVGAPSEDQRCNIIYNLCSPLNLKLSEDEYLDLCKTIGKMTPGYVGADLRQLCQLVTLDMFENHYENQNTSLPFWLSIFKKALLNMTPTSLKGNKEMVKQISTNLDDLAGIQTVKKQLEMAILWPLKHIDAFRRMGLQRTKGILLYGPPGCAKTSLVRALSNIGLLSLLSISAAELYSPYVGDAERLICEMFDRARQNSPCILFIDEIDALAGTRSVGKEKGLDVQERIIAALLTQMDGLGQKLTSSDLLENKLTDESDGIIVIGATNRPDMIDTALLRPGRFDKLIHVPPPDCESRREILISVTKNMPLSEDCDLNDIAIRTNLCSGADLKNICTEAALTAMLQREMNVEKIQQSDFLSVLSKFRPSLTENIIEQYKSFENNK